MPIEKVINAPPKDLSQFNILLGGPKKIGKSSLAAQWPNSHLAECEPGNALHIRCSYTDIPDIKALDAFLKDASDTEWVQTWILDEISAPYNWILQQTCNDEGVLDPSEVPHGKLWGVIKRRYMERIDKLFGLTGGKILTAHACQKTVKTVTRKEITTYECDYGATIRKGLVDPRIHNVWLMDYCNDERVIILQGDDYYKACTANLEEHFKTPEGRSIRIVPLGTRAKEGYENLINAFNNELELPEEYLVPESSPVTKTSQPVKKFVFGKGK